jgi:hypothetical protein
MDFVNSTFEGDKAYILPIGDIHFGDRAFQKEGRRKLKGNLEWLRSHEQDARSILMGDIFNIAGRNDKTSPYETDPEEIHNAEEFFRPYKDLFIGAIRGNHENRLVNSYGFDPLKGFCKNLGIPYLGISALIRIQVGARPAEVNGYWQSYYMYVHHTTGGGKSLGSALSRVEALDKIMTGCDVYAGGHNHQMATGVKNVYTPTSHGPRLQKVHFVNCGSYLEWAGSYAESGQFAPSKLGSPRIRFSGVRGHHDIHISL